MTTINNIKTDTRSGELYVLNLNLHTKQLPHYATMLISKSESIVGRLLASVAG